MATRGKKVSEHCRKQIAKNLATGRSLVETAKEAGVSPRTVYNYRQDGEVRAMIEEAQRRMAEAVPDIVEADLAVIRKARDIIEKDKGGLEDNKVLLELYRAISKRIGQSVGILPSPTPSIFVQQHFQTNNNLSLSPEVAAILAGVHARIEDDAAFEILEEE